MAKFGTRGRVKGSEKAGGVYGGVDKAVKGAAGLLNGATSTAADAIARIGSRPGKVTPRPTDVMSRYSTIAKRNDPKFNSQRGPGGSTRTPKDPRNEKRSLANKNRKSAAKRVKRTYTRVRSGTATSNGNVGQGAGTKVQRNLYMRPRPKPAPVKPRKTALARAGAKVRQRNPNLTTKQVRTRARKILDTRPGKGDT